ncbi:MAG: ABC transporter permease [Cytophagales bacterium]|nr:MAG: ABC transporter permease [Cytophagales bacterium]
MNFYYFLSQRINSNSAKSFSGLVNKIAIISVAISLAAMMISFAILHGFKHQIQEKIFSFGGHIKISKYDIKNSLEESPISNQSPFYEAAKNHPEILHIQTYSHKAALLKTQEGVSGIMLKGISKDFDTLRFAKNLIQGHLPYINDTSYSRSFAISQKIALKMNLHLGDTAIVFFVQQPPRFRKLAVCGIYETSMEEFDDVVAFCDQRLNQVINHWEDTLVGGFEILIKDFSKIDTVSNQMLELLDYDMQLEKVTDQYLQLFEWLKLLDKNVVIFLSLILLVAGFNIISTLFIMIMESTAMIGILKALGATNYQIQKIFVYLGLQIIAKGLFWGNLIGLSLCAVQYFFRIIPLDPSTYYMPFAPIYWDWKIFFLLNLIAFLLIAILLLIPVMIIANIKPVKAIRWD